VGKNKLDRWAEMERIGFVVQPSFEDVYQKDYSLKGQWSKVFFQNSHAIVLELGCGKGEYTVGLAKRFPQMNFIGMDIKGARMWKGAVTARKEGLKNVVFLRSRIELLASFFDENEISGIWLTFPDPQPKRRREKKRLTHPKFIEVYRKILDPDGYIHLKTDNIGLFDYTMEVISQNNFPVDFYTKDLYREQKEDPEFEIRTYYEKQFLEEGRDICYLRFKPTGDKPIINPLYV